MSICQEVWLSWRPDRNFVSLRQQSVIIRDLREVAQLVERVVRNDEVGSSILLFSTTIPRSYLPSVGRFYL